MLFKFSISLKSSDHHLKWNIEVTNQYCRPVYFSLQFCQCLLHIHLGLCGTMCLLCLLGELILCQHKCLCVLQQFFDLKSILSNTTIATPAVFCLLFAWNIFLHLFVISVIVSQILDLSISWTAHPRIICHCLLNQFLSLIGKRNPFPVTVPMRKNLLLPFCYLVFCISYIIFVSNFFHYCSL